MEQLKQVKGLIVWFFSQFPDSVLIAMSVMGLGCGVLFCLHLIGSKEGPTTSHAAEIQPHAYNHLHLHQSNNGPVPIYDQEYVRTRFGSPIQTPDYGFMAGRASAFD